ncbi:MAG: lipid kinase YegS [Bythopirellula sp.]
MLRVIVNGKAVADPLLRPAIGQLRDQGHRVEVRVTWESGDATRYAAAARSDGVQVVVAAGGDGTINEVASGLLQQGPCQETALAVVPYGTANDFATGIGILKGDPFQSLRLAAESDATPIDVGKVNGRIFVNVTSGGFGAEVTSNTPPQMKKVLGGAAYSLMGIVTAAKMNPYECRLTMPDGVDHEGLLLIMAVGNGRQCGGGYQVTPQALLDDGLLDVVVVHDVEIQQLGLVLSELSDLTSATNKFVNYSQVPSFALESSRPLQLNLDGEAYLDTSFVFEVVPRALPFVLGPEAPLVS